MRIVTNEIAIRALLKSDEVVSACMKPAQAVVEQAQATAPVGSEKSDPHPGQYRDSITAIPRASSNRAWVQVGSPLPYAPKIEADRGILAAALDAGRSA